MTFLNWALLGGALALAIPIIIHLFHKSRFQVVKWGAMHLLQSVMRTNQRRIRIEQLILLAIRCAIPLLLALCMARPVWKGFQTLIGDAKTSTIILLDNSYSMEMGRTGTTNFTLARDEAARLLNELKPGSDAQVVLMGEGGAPLLDEPTYDIARLNQALGKLNAGYGAATVPAALDYAANLFGRMRESNRQLILFTDFQRLSFEATEDKLLGQMIDRLKSLPMPPHITFWDIGAEARDNVAIESLDFSRLMVGVGQRLQIRANLRNFGDNKYPDLRIYFKVDGQEKAASQINLGAREEGQVLFTHIFDQPGSHVIELYADADPLKADNIYLASIPVRDRLPLLLVNGAPSGEALKGETDFAEIALQPYGAGRVELADLIKTATIKPEELNAQRLVEQAVVVLANVRRLNDDQVKALEDFVKNGGGLMIFPGDKVEVPWYNSALLKDGKGLLPLAFGPLAGDPKGTSSVSVVGQRFDNPALEIFNDPRNGSLSDAQIKAWFRLQERGQTVSTTDTVTLARLDSGDPFLAEKAYGEGRVILSSVPCDADWSNLPLRPFYLPLMQRLSVYLASTVFPPRNLDVGRPLISFLDGSTAGKRASLTRPDGSITELPIVKKGERGVVEYPKTQQPGLYTVTPPGGAPVHYVVNASRKESDLARLTDQEITDLAKTHGVNLVRSDAEFKQLDRTRRFGMEFWRPLLWGLLAFLFLELFLQQRFSMARSRA